VTDWGLFPDTVLQFKAETPLSLDLRYPINASALTRLQTLGFERAFGIVTASNPMGVVLTEEDNFARARTLNAEVERLHATRLYVDACSPDRSHCEASVAISLTLQALVAIADRFDQLAVFWFDGDVFWIEPVRSNYSRLRLPAIP